jgi:hypothetical protein
MSTSYSATTQIRHVKRIQQSKTPIATTQAAYLPKVNKGERLPSIVKGSGPQMVLPHQKQRKYRLESPKNIGGHKVMANYSPRYSSGASNPGDISGENEGLSLKPEETPTKLLLDNNLLMPH